MADKQAPEWEAVQIVDDYGAPSVVMSRCRECGGLYIVPQRHFCNAEEAQYTLRGELEPFEFWLRCRVYDGAK